MKKPIQILLLIFLLQTLVSCCEDVKFFNYNEVMLGKVDVLISADEQLFLEIQAMDIRYMADVPSFGLTSAQAFSCYDGWGGMKDPIMGISVTSNAAFDSLHTAGAPLDDIFDYRSYYTPDDNTYKPLNTIHELSAYSLSLRLDERPTHSDTHQFTIRIRKCSGETIIVQTEEVVWEN